MKNKKFINSKFHIKRENNKGTAMIVAIIIMTILIVFTFSLALIAYTLYSSQTKNIASMKCSEAANTLSKAISDELIYTDALNGRYPEYESYLYKYLRYNLCQDSTWPYYVEGSTGIHSRENAVRYFDLKYNSAKIIYDDEGEAVQDSEGNNKTVNGVEGLPGKTEVAIYWMLPDGIKPSDIGETPSLLKTRKGVKLFVEVTCEVASQSYTVKNEYVLNTFAYNVNDTTEYDRCSFLKKAQNNTAINPCGLKIDDMYDDIYSNEKWEWSRVISD